MAKKILIFSLDYLPGTISGAEEAIKEITDRIAPEEVEFHMVTLYYDRLVPKTQKIGNVFIHYIGLFGKPNASLVERKQFPLHVNKHYFQIAAGVKGYLLHRRYHYDALWGVMAHGTGVPAVIFKWFAPNVPYVLTLQEGDPPEHIERMVRPLWFIWKQCFTKAQAITCISNFLAAWAKRRGAKCFVTIVPNGANIESVTPNFTDSEITDLAQRLGKKESDIFLVNTARLVHQKGFDVTIHALLDLPEHIKLLIVGGGPDEAKLRKLAQELSIENRVIFTGQVDRSVVSKYRAVADIFVGPSRSEGLGNAFLSAMAGGIPVIATQAGGIADFLFDKKKNPTIQPTGWAVEVDNPKQIADTVQYILDHPSEVKEVTERARHRVVEKYNWDSIAQKMKDVLLSVAQ